jgi:hypothetical protein
VDGERGISSARGEYICGTSDGDDDQRGDTHHQATMSAHHASDELRI